MWCNIIANQMPQDGYNNHDKPYQSLISGTLQASEYSGQFGIYLWYDLEEERKAIEAFIS